MTSTWDAIVVGGRVAGTSTAMLLARAGCRVLVLERQRPGADTLSTHALMRAGALQLRRWGLLDTIAAAGTPAVRRTIFHYGDEAVAVSIKPIAGIDALYAPRRTLLDATLAGAASSAGASVRYGARVTGLHRASDGRVAGVLVSDPDGRVTCERSALVIGADGRSSLVAESVGARTMIQGQAASAFLYTYVEGFPSSRNEYEFFYAPARTAGAIPTTGGRTCVFVGGPPADLADRVRAVGPYAAFADVARECSAPLHARLAHARRVEPVRYDRGRPGHLRTAWGRGWALVGDAGYWKDPLSTHGMTDALRDAELLARSAVQALDAPAGPAGPSGQRALAAYQDRRDALSWQMIPVVERLAGYRWSLDDVRGLLRELSSAMTGELEALAVLPDAA